MTFGLATFFSTRNTNRVFNITRSVGRHSHTIMIPSRSAVADVALLPEVKYSGHDPN
jgi:hypothetical protein